MTDGAEHDPDILERQAVEVGALATGLDRATVGAVVDVVAPLLRRAHTLRMIERTRALYTEFPATRPPQEAVDEVLDSWMRSVDRQ